MKTHEEKLNELTNAIRQSIPRLMELSEGCLIYDNKRNDCYIVVMNHKNVLECILNGVKITAMNKELNENYTIIGHEPLLNDVMEWLGTIKEVEDYLIYSDGYIKEYSYILKDYYYMNVTWDLTKSKLKDQSPELIDFLHELIPTR